MKKRPNRSKAFTLVELLVVIGIIALLLSILIPTLSKARASAQSLRCLSNLRQCGLAIHMYASANKQYLPYPTTTLDPNDSVNQGYLWFNAIDQYLNSNRKGQENRTGVASARTYKAFKQCPVYESFIGDKTSGGQSTDKEFARTYKMNSHLRRVPRLQNARFSGDLDARGTQARITDVRRSAEFVMLGDGISMDFTGQIASNFENGQFSFEVNDITEASPAIRHMKGANILFVDGHAITAIDVKRIKKNLRAPQNNIVVETWESEYLNAGGVPVDINTTNKDEFKTIEALGLRRNPNMPFRWSDPPRLYRY